MLRVAGFDWDAGNWPKCAKHGVSQAEIEDVLASARFAVNDPSPAEKRLRTAGRAGNGRHVFVVFTLREKPDGMFVRPISARYMHMKEVESFEKEMANIAKR